MLKEKELIENKYEVKKKLNDNHLYLVTDLRMMTSWMVKEISREKICEKCLNVEEDQEAFISELEQMKKINHRIFPKVVEILKTEEYLYVVMEPVLGKKLSEAEKKSQKEIVTWAIRLCDGFKKAEQVKMPHIKWKYSMDDIRLEDGNIRLQDFDIFPEKEKILSEEIKEVAEFIRAGENLKLAKKLQVIIQKCMDGNEEYGTYERLSDALERYLIETAKKQKMKKRICSAGAIAAMIVMICFTGIKILNSKKVNLERQAKPPEKPKQTEDVQQTEKEGIVKKLQADAKEVENFLKEKETDINMVPFETEKTKTPEIVSTKRPQKTPTVASKTEKPVKTPDTTQEVEKAIEPVTAPVKAPVMEQPQKTESSSVNVKVVTPQPKKKSVATSKPIENTVKPKKTKAPQSIEIELEDNSMEITVGE